MALSAPRDRMRHLFTVRGEPVDENAVLRHTAVSTLGPRQHATWLPAVMFVNTFCFKNS